MSFQGKIAVVTGGASGIGLATARLLTERGAEVTVWDRNCAKQPVDVSDPAQLQASVERLPRVDILVHSAGIQTYGTVTGTDDATWDRTMLVNVTAGFYVCRAVLPKMLAGGGGSISLIGSVQSVGAIANSAAYVTSKHALLGLAKSIALDYARQGVRCNCVCPGAIDTPMLRWSADQTEDPEATLRACAQMHPIGRLGTAEDIARVVAFLSSEDAAFVTGTAFLADGGALVPIGGAAFQENGTARAGR